MSASAGNGESQIAKLAPDESAHPRSWPTWWKWTIVTSITLVDLTVSFGASGYSPVGIDFAKDLHVSSEVARLDLSLYVLGLALGPMFIAAVSEYNGRTPLYLIPYGIFFIFLAGTELVTDLGASLTLCLLSGILSSVTIANFGGTIADLWPRDQIGPATNIQSWTCCINLARESLSAKSRGQSESGRKYEFGPGSPTWDQ